MRVFCLLLLCLTQLTTGEENWPQVSGSDLNYQVAGVTAPPAKWSIVRNENILWRTTLPEGGQSSVTVWGDKAFVTTHKPIDESSDRLEPHIVGYCLDSNSGKILWQVELPGTDPVSMAGIFSDGTVFAPITDGEHVWFFNRCGSMGCYSMEGKQVWLREFQPRPRHTNRQCEPILHGDIIVTVEVRNKQQGQKMQRHKPVPEGIDPKEVWTYLHGIDKNTGEIKWIGEAGTAIHNTPMFGMTKSGVAAVFHGRGGGHGPLETPYGVSLTNIATGKALWSNDIGKCDSVFNSHWNNKEGYWFQGPNHLVFSSETGELLRTQDVTKSVTFHQFHPEDGSWTKAVKDVKAGRRHPNTNQTNIVVGKWHYFLAHDFVALGRVNVETGETQYLELPVQVVAGADDDRLIRDTKKALANDTKNSRGIDIAIDGRAKKTGFGHVSAASPVAVNGILYIPVMNGTTYVVDTRSADFGPSSLLAVNDLGKAGETWTLASFSCVNGRLYMHTMKEIICIGPL
ncbi:MAG: PQQ-binding-like beta-propeller repeat protein [Verrucomicrobiales bacterium]|nr:PQQ-binding-like beta-propeller repeat protein [Verrucomicrobiales bacterium]